LYYYTTENKEHQRLLEKNNSPIQLVNQLKGYFFINPVLSLSLTITIFSFVGIPPLVGFFAKQMVLSAALDSGLVFLALVAILTSVIGGIYYLTIIKEMFFSLPDNIESKISNKNYSILGINNKKYAIQSVKISSPISFIISNITLIILLFLFINKE
jgi:NADH-ubiquinone oxidoreductase chain 2